jgi:hypothetical protein
MQQLAGTRLLVSTLGVAAQSPIPTLSRTTEANSGTAFFESSLMWIVLVLAALCAPLYVWNGGRSAPSRPRRFTVAVSVLALSFAVFRALAAPLIATGQWAPNFDLVTLALLAIGITGALTMDGRGEVAARGAALISDAVSVSEETSQVVNDYVAETTQLVGTLKDGNDGEMLLELDYPDPRPRLNLFVTMRMVSAYQWLAPSDDPMITVWVAGVRDKERLYFGWCSHNVGPAHALANFEADKGVAGAAFTEHVVRNEVNPARLQIFTSLGVPYPYTSMLAIPIDFGSRTIGVLCIDRKRDEQFDATTVSVMKALASNLGTAIGLAEQNS